MHRIIVAMLAGGLAVALCLILLAWTHGRQDSVRWEEMEEETRLAAVQLSGRLRGGLQEQLIAVSQMATFFENSEEVSEPEFRHFAAATMRASPLSLRISYVDPAMRIRWVHPPEFSPSLVGFDTRSHAEGTETIRRAIERREPALSEPLKLVGGSGGVLLAAAAFKEDRLAGVIVTAIRTADFFEVMVSPSLSTRFKGSILDGNRVLYTTMVGGDAGKAAPAASESFQVGGRTWLVRVRLRPEISTVRLHDGEEAFWSLGILVTLTIGGGVGAGTHRLMKQTAALSVTRQELDGAREQLLQAEKLTALGELVAGVAHEINNPLAGILGFTQLVLREDLPAGVRRRLETVTAETQRASKIVSNLLTFARKHPPEKQHLGLNGVIEKTVDMRFYQLRVNQIRVETDLDPDLPMTMLDFHQIQQVLLNLLNNAEQAIQEAGKGGMIRISTRVADGSIVARVADDGPGIPEEIRRRIFDPFFTTKSEGKGTGLGLSLCFGIMNEHGGSIRVESEPGKGTTFVLELPIIHAAGVRTESVEERPAPSPESLYILAVDDEPSLLSLLVEILTSLGHRVDTASDVPEALRKVGSADHDLIICDMKMPRGSGRDVYEALRARTPEASRRIVFTSGDGRNPDTVRFLRETDSQLLQKPYRIEEIERIIASHGRP